MSVSESRLSDLVAIICVSVTAYRVKHVLTEAIHSREVCSSHMLLTHKNYLLRLTAQDVCS